MAMATSRSRGFHLTPPPMTFDLAPRRRSTGRSALNQRSNDPPMTDTTLRAECWGVGGIDRMRHLPGNLPANLQRNHFRSNRIHSRRVFGLGIVVGILKCAPNDL